MDMRKLMLLVVLEVHVNDLTITHIFGERLTD